MNCRKDGRTDEFHEPLKIYNISLVLDMVVL